MSWNIYFDMAWKILLDTTIFDFDTNQPKTLW